METNQLGEFSKGNEMSRSANFSDSGAENCSNKCKLKKHSADDDGMCYAIKIEKIYPSVKEKNAKTRTTSPTIICNKINVELSSLKNIWLRFSALGSLPMISKAKKTAGFETAFKNMVVKALKRDCKIHLPIEETKKAAYYQGLINEVTDEVVVRESCQSEKRLRNCDNHCSYVIGQKGTPMKQRINEARELAAELRADGKKTVVCPAIRERNYTGRKAKCGDCTACASKGVDVVLYPLH